MTAVQTLIDFQRQAREFGIEPIMPKEASTAPIMRGRNGMVRLWPGVCLHFSEAIDLQDCTLAADCPPNISVKVFLSGRVDACIGGIPIPMPKSSANGKSWEPIAVLLAQPHTDRFVRRAAKGNMLRKVTVSFTREWLQEKCGPDDATWIKFDGFAKCHLAMRTWLPSPAAVAACEQILSAPELPPLIELLYLESRALVLIEEALEQLLCRFGDDRKRCLHPSELQRLILLDKYIDEQPFGPITSEILAAHAGTSANTLRRLIRNTHGVSLLEYVRRRKLEAARSALQAGKASIAEAAHMAGYSSTANFSTAFKRLFSVSPGRVVSNG